jgi:hypothetical protein
MSVKTHLMHTNTTDFGDLKFKEGSSNNCWNNYAMSFYQKCYYLFVKHLANMYLFISSQTKKEEWGKNVI